MTFPASVSMAEPAIRTVRNTGSLPLAIIFGQSKIRHLHPATGDPINIFRIDVAMNDALIVRVLQRIANLRTMASASRAETRPACKSCRKSHHHEVHQKIKLPHSRRIRTAYNARDDSTGHAPGFPGGSDRQKSASRPMSRRENFQCHDAASCFWRAR